METTDWNSPLQGDVSIDGTQLPARWTGLREDGPLGLGNSKEIANLYLPTGDALGVDWIICRL